MSSDIHCFFCQYIPNISQPIRVGRAIRSTFSSRLAKTKKWVTSEIQKASYVAGYSFLQAHNIFFNKQQISLPLLFEHQIRKGLGPSLDYLIANLTSNVIEQIKRPIYDIYDPLKRGCIEYANHAQEVINKTGLPVVLLEERFKHFLHFIVEGKLYRYIQYYDHQLIFDEVTQELYLTVNGTLLSSKEVMERFCLMDRSARERLFLPPFIIDRETGERWAYLEQGLVLHNTEADIKHYKILSEKPNTPQIIVKFCLNGNFDSPKGINEFDYHTWCDIVCTDGKVYSFGLFAQGVIQNPDPFEFYKKNIKAITIEVDSDDVAAAFAKITQIREEGPGKFHLTKYNCSSFIREICTTVNVNVSEKCLVSSFNNFKNRIRLYALSYLISNLIKKPELYSKLVTIKELFRIKKQFDLMPFSIKKLISKFSIEKCIESIKIMNTLYDYPELNNYVNALKIVQKIVQIDAGEMEKTFLSELITPDEIQKVLDTFIDDSKQELTNKIYNLIERILENLSNYELSNPAILYHELSELCDDGI